jgi:hypothetical protein
VKVLAEKEGKEPLMPLEESAQETYTRTLVTLVLYLCRLAAQPPQALFDDPEGENVAIPGLPQALHDLTTTFKHDPTVETLQPLLLGLFEPFAAPFPRRNCHPLGNFLRLSCRKLPLAGPERVASLEEVNHSLVHLKYVARLAIFRQGVDDLAQSEALLRYVTQTYDF